MARPRAKPPEQQDARPDPLIGKPVRIVRGRHTGKEGIARRCYRDRVATPDYVHVEQEGGMPGWYVAALISDVEIVR